MNVAGVDPQILLMYRVFDVSGVLLMGVIGGTIARQRGFDIVGFLFIALFSALGGGMIRDVLINQGTVAAMATPEYLILAFTGSIIARFVYFKGKAWEQVQVHGDAIVSGLWAATGCVKAITFELPFLSCVMLGVFTAVGGGMIRDVVTGHVPGVFGNNIPAVIPAVAVTLVVLTAKFFGFLAWGMVAGPIVGIALTLYGYWAGWRIHADAEWAPVNRAVTKAERESRKVAREIEPRRVRAWRHRQMEKALERRELKAWKKNQAAGTPQGSAEEMLDALTSEFEVVQPEAETSDFGLDFGGGSYDDYDADTGLETGHFEAVDRDTAGQGDLDSGRMTNELIDLVLADDKLLDELLGRLERKYRERD